MTTDGVESLSANLAELFVEVPDPVLVLDPEGRVQWGNHAAERLFNRSLHDSIGFSGIELVHPDDLELVLRSLTSVQHKEVGTLIEVRAKAAKGWVLLEVLGAPVNWLGKPAVLFCLRDLTERRRFEVARGEEAKFRSLMQNSAAMTILVSPTGVVDSVSGALSRMLGHDPELVEHQPLADLVLPADRPALLAAALELASRGAIHIQPGHGRRRDAPPRKHRVGALRALVRQSRRRPHGRQVSSSRLTTSRPGWQPSSRCAEPCRCSPRRLSRPPTAFSSSIPPAGFTSFNGRFAELWRLPAAILAARDDAAAITFAQDQLADSGGVRSQSGELYASPEAESSDVIEFIDGRVFERYSSPQRVDGAIVGRVWSFRDVTDRKRTEEELRESEQRFRQVFNQGPLGIALVDLDSRITTANRALCRFVGRRRTQVIGSTFESFTHPEDVEKDTELARQMSRGCDPELPDRDALSRRAAGTSCSETSRPR